MKQEFLKRAGVQTEEEFYNKYPTEESFFNSFPQMKKMVKGGDIVDGMKKEDIISDKRNAVLDFISSNVVSNMKQSNGHIMKKGGQSIPTYQEGDEVSSEDSNNTDNLVSRDEYNKLLKQVEELISRSENPYSYYGYNPYSQNRYYGANYFPTNFGIRQGSIETSGDPELLNKFKDIYSGDTAWDINAKDLGRRKGSLTASGTTDEGRYDLEYGYKKRFLLPNKRTVKLTYTPSGQVVPVEEESPVDIDKIADDAIIENSSNVDMASGIPGGQLPKAQFGITSGINLDMINQYQDILDKANNPQSFEAEITDPSRKLTPQQWTAGINLGIQGITSLFEKGEAKRREEQLAEGRLAHNAFDAQRTTDRGDYDQFGNFRPDSKVPVQFTGAAPRYQEGGEYDLSDEEIAKLKEQGYDIEIL